VTRTIVPHILLFRSKGTDRVAVTENLHFCSNLVTVHLPTQEGGARETVGNLEEISTTGACINLEEPVETGLPLRLVCSKAGQNVEFPGTVVECRHDARAGYYVSVVFNPGVHWSPEVYTPKHLVRGGSFLTAEAAISSAEGNCCERGICPKEVISRLIDPEFPLSRRVRAVAREVASLCGELTEDEAAHCFGSLFGAGAECRLFGEFQSAYRKARRKGPRPRRRGLRSQVEAVVQLSCAVPQAAVESDSCSSAAPWPAPTVPPSEK